MKGADVKLRELDVSIADLGNISQEQSQPRSAGLHVSSIIKFMMLMSGLEKENDFTDDDLDMFATVGRLWEAQLAQAMFTPPRCIRPGEVEVDGIIGSPDAIDTEDLAVLEFKACWKSSGRDIQSSSFWKWWIQIKAYCWMLQVTKARLYVFFVNGNYKPPVPAIKAWNAEFSAGELKENWALLLRNAKDMP